VPYIGDLIGVRALHGVVPQVSQPARGGYALALMSKLRPAQPLENSPACGPARHIARQLFEQCGGAFATAQPYGVATLRAGCSPAAQRRAARARRSGPPM